MVDPVSAMPDEPVMRRVMAEQQQGFSTRRHLFDRLEESLGRPVVSFFTSFKYPVMIEDDDADMLAGVLQETDASNGLVLMISSPGGDALAAERIIKACRSYSGTGEYWAIVPSKAKSAATMVCFGASKIHMGPTSELGPVDPQFVTSDGGRVKRFSVHNLIRSYQELFQNAVNLESGNLEPFLQQLQKYDAREIEEHRTQLELSEDIALKALGTGMMSGKDTKMIRKKITPFLKPSASAKVHGRPIYRDDATGCGLDVEPLEVGSTLWDLVYELYLRTDNYVSTQAAKCIESKNAGVAAPPSE